MATSYTTLLGLALPATGELSGTWGDTVNNYISNYIDASVAGAQTVTTDTTLTKTTGSSLGATSSQYAIIIASPASANITITAPAASKIYTIINTSGTYTVKICGAGPTTGVTLGVNEKAQVAWNGSDFVKIGSPLSTPYTANGVVYASSSSALTTGSALTFDGTNVQIGATGALRFADTDSSNYVAFKSPSVVSANVTWTLPSADGTSGQALSTNGSGTLSWATSSSLTGVTQSASPYLTALGYQAGNVNTGTNNTALGYQAGLNTTSGFDNCYVGSIAGQTNTTGRSNTAVGRYCMSGSTGSYNTAVGNEAGLTLTGSYNCAFGFQTYNNASSSGSYNSSFGTQSLYNNTTGASLTAVGYQALRSNTTGQSNTAVGYQALYTNTGNYQSTAVGYQALYSSNATLSSASYNDAFGCQALYSCTTGVGNVAMGSFGYAGSSSALWSCTTGSNNTALGQGALRALTTGSGMTAVGSTALWNATTGDSNVCIGNSSGYEITTGSRNVFIGNGTGVGGFGVSGPITTGEYNIMIGMTACGSSPSVSNAIVIAAIYSQQDKGSSTGFIAPGGGGVYQGNNSSTWSQTSDQRLKKNIVDNTIGLEKINGIRVRNFEYRLPEEVDPELKPADAIKKSGVQLGVIAQELQQVLPDCVKQESTGVLAVDPDNLTWYTINAIKELSAEVASLKSKLNGV